MTMVAQAERSWPRTEPRRGDTVRVRSREEILATLDPTGSIDALPFMPEMLEFAGQELTVWARADKTCDYVGGTGNKTMTKTVHLLGARCSGSAHGGCQARCNLFWREEWLEWPDRPGEPISPPEPRETPVTEETLHAATIVSPSPDLRYSCQATEHPRATAPMPRHNWRQYAHDVKIRNVSLSTALRGLAIYLFKRYQRLSARKFPSWLRIRGGRDYPFIVTRGTGERLPETEFQPGDLVEIRSKEEILATLDSAQKNRNLFFDEEMLPYCGRRVRVLGKVTHIVDEFTGKPMKLGDCYMLEDVVCLGLYKRFCQRAIPPYWRSGWLKKIDASLGLTPPLPGQIVRARR